jgi:hypothetical protein
MGTEEPHEPRPRNLGRRHTKVTVHKDKQPRRRRRRGGKAHDVHPEAGVAEILDESGTVVGTTPFSAGDVEGDAAPGGNDPVVPDVKDVKEPDVKEPAANE